MKLVVLYLTVFLQIFIILCLKRKKKIQYKHHFSLCHNEKCYDTKKIQYLLIIWGRRKKLRLH